MADAPHRPSAVVCVLVVQPSSTTPTRSSVQTLEERARKATLVFIVPLRQAVVVVVIVFITITHRHDIQQSALLQRSQSLEKYTLYYLIRERFVEN